MIAEIQAIVERQIQAMSLCNIAVGIVRSLGPVRVELPSGIVLTKSELLLSATLLPKEYDPFHIHMVTTEDFSTYTSGPIPDLETLTLEGFHVGDRVLLIRATGGQKYVLVSQLVEISS